MLLLDASCQGSSSSELFQLAKSAWIYKSASISHILLFEASSERFDCRGCAVPPFKATPSEFVCLEVNHSGAIRGEPVSHLSTHQLLIRRLFVNVQVQVD
jgi:hypothetical protein